MKSVWGCECCPQLLRQQLGISGKSSVARWLPNRPWIWAVAGLAAAAVVAIATAAPLLLRQPAGAGSASPAVAPQIASPIAPQAAPQLASALPLQLQTELVATHEHCCQSSNHHHLDAAGADDAQIAQAMRARLSRAVLVARPQGDGWTFRGAAICHVGPVASGHLVFVCGDKALSIFSLPLSADPSARPGESLSADLNGHPIVAFVKDDALFCLVGSGPSGSITTQQLLHLRDRVENDVLASDATPVAVADAELLQPVAP